MEKSLPYAVSDTVAGRRSPRRLRLRVALPLLLALGCFLVIVYGFAFGQGIAFWEAYVASPSWHAHHDPHLAPLVSRCRSLHAKAGPPRDFAKRSVSDRYVPGTRPVLLKNAKIWTGEKNGTEVVHADVLLDKGIIKGVGHTSLLARVVKRYGEELLVVDAKGAWVTPGIVDLHSHLGDDPSPALEGTSDGNSLKGTIQPWLRALDGLNTHDDSYPLSIAGGVTTALVLPGSANAIGGQGFTIKLRKTAERSPTSMLLEPPYQINNSFPHIDTPRWRQMKHACGENPSRVYGNTRMDNVWAWRQAYNKAREIKEAQDEFCVKVEAGKFDEVAKRPFPEDLQWEALVDVLRGRVKVQIHCYQPVDIDDVVRLSNEFQFPVAAFHHAHEAYLVPDLIKQTYDHTPAVAMFATNARYKLEAYRGSEFAPRILAQNGIDVVMKSDHPVLDSRYLLFEAQQAYLYGLPENLAIASVTSTPAKIMGMDHRIGFIKEGWDADLVIWDSHPLALGATPTQVLIDGIPQLSDPHITYKPAAFQNTPEVPNFDKETAEAVKYEGLPPLEPKKTATGLVAFLNVRSVYGVAAERVQEVFSFGADREPGMVVVQGGKVTCSGTESYCLTPSLLGQAEVIDLRGGSIAPGLTTFGSPLGLAEIDAEPSTNDGAVYDPLIRKVPSILGSETTLVRAVDGLQFGGRSALLAYRSGVVNAITAPRGELFYAGLSTAFSTGALNKLEEGAVIQEVNAVHVAVRHFGAQPSVSTQIATLRRLLFDPPKGNAGRFFQDVKDGKIPLVVDADSADIIATLILLKGEIEDRTGVKIRLTITGAIEAHLLAKEIAEASIGIIQVPARPFPTVWERKRILPGHPLSEESSIQVLLKHNVTVGVGIEEAWSARNTRFDIAWVALDAGGDISRAQAIAIGSTNVEKLLGGKVETADDHEFVATEGGDLLDFQSKVKAVISPRRGFVHLL